MTEQHKLENEHLSIVVDEHGAELKSVVHRSSGVEYLWQSDPRYWGRSSPILFPIVGRLKSDRYRLNDRVYTLSQHGFARDSPFSLVITSENRLVFELSTKKHKFTQYPFNFALKVSYELSNNQVAIAYIVDNVDTRPMFFSIGSHPAFNAPLTAGEINDYFIEFGSKEESECYRVTPEGLQSPPEPSPLQNGSVLPLKPDLFEQGAIMFKRIASDTIQLRNHCDGRRITVEPHGAPYLGLWAPVGAPFVCIEPWFGIADHPATNGEISQKEGILKLEPSASFEAQMTIAID